MSSVRECPWCGAAPSKYPNHHHERSAVSVYCDSCGTGGPMGIDATEAMRKWNTRPVEAEMLALLKRVAKDEIPPEHGDKRQPIGLDLMCEIDALVAKIEGDDPT